MPYFKKLSSRTAWFVVAIICLLSFSLMLWASLTDSAIMDELAHIPAGYGYVHNLDYRLNPEHPPLIKALAMLPVLFLNPNFPTQSSAWTDEINSQWAVGAQFLYESGNDANQIIRLARFGPMLITILTVILIYIWSRELIGEWWALLPTLLFALSPTVLAHGHYVTTDVGAAFGVLFATYFFLKFLRAPSRKHLAYAGLAFGVATIAKFSTALLVPYFVIIIVAFYLVGVRRDWNATEVGLRFKRFFTRGLRYLKALVAIFVIGYVFIVYPVYFLFTTNYPLQKQTADTTYILQSFANGPTPAGKLCEPMRCLANLDIWMAGHAATRPLAEYMLGILMVFQRSSGGNTSYFLGQVSAAGSILYFPIVYLFKEPLPVLIMILIAVLYTIITVAKKIRDKSLAAAWSDYLENNFAQFSMLVFIIIYWAWSMKSPLNIGFRHLFPTIPLIYILTAGVWKKWITNADVKGFGFGRGMGLVLGIIKNMFVSLFKYALLVLLVILFFAETVFAAPYFLSYFNELGGGIWGGYRYVTDSNYDWGQDLLRLQNFVNAHPEIDKIAVDYFGGGSPKYYLGEKEVDWSSSKGNPSGTQIGADETRINADNNIGENQRSNLRKSAIRWLAISINTLQGAIQPLAPGQQRNPEDEYRWLSALRARNPEPGEGRIGNVPKPDYRAGTSIFIYKL